MDWQIVAAVGELLGAAGVIGSLVYLASQVRSNSAQVEEAAAQNRQAATQTVINQMNAVMEGVSTAEQASIFTRGIKGLGELDGYAEVAQFSARMYTICRTYETLLHYRSAGWADDWVWQGIDTMMSDVLANPGVAEWWAVRGHWFSPELREHVAPIFADVTRGLELDYDRRLDLKWT